MNASFAATEDHRESPTSGVRLQVLGEHKRNPTAILRHYEHITAAVSRLWMRAISPPQAPAWGYLLLPRRGKDKHNLRRAHGVSRAGSSLP